LICEKGSDIFPECDETNSQVCVVDYSMNIMRRAKEESCGSCVLCREGTWQAYQIMKDITEGNAKSEDFELLMDLLSKIERNASCEMSKKAAESCMNIMKRHEEEWDMHIRRKRCKNLICKGTYTLYIDPNECNGCGMCLNSCPKNAITGGEEMIHVIRTDICDKTMACMFACPKNAVKKAGSMKPKIPDEPVPVGSFGTAQSEEEGGGRRRRRRGGE